MRECSSRPDANRWTTVDHERTARLFVPCSGSFEGTIPQISPGNGNETNQEAAILECSQFEIRWWNKLPFLRQKSSVQERAVLGLYSAIVASRFAGRNLAAWGRKSAKRLYDLTVEGDECEGSQGDRKVSIYHPEGSLEVGGFSARRPRRHLCWGHQSTGASESTRWRKCLQSDRWDCPNLSRDGGEH